MTAIAVATAGVVALPHAAIGSVFSEQFGGYRPVLSTYDPERAPQLFGIPHRRHHRKPEAERDAETAKAPKPLAGPVMIAVSIGSQHLTVYENGTAVAAAPISSGMKGHATPMGVFSVIQKERWHRSNLYSNAPMPFMQRITWSGVALHAGVLPGYPASHGCIRLPADFAARLWTMTRMGARVIVTRNEVTPFEIDHPHLAALTGTSTAGPREEPASPPADATVHDAAEAPDPGAVERVAKVLPAVVSRDIAFTPMTSGAPPVQRVVSDDKAVPFRPAIDLLAPAPAPVTPAEPMQGKPAEPARRPGPVSLFVSRQEGKLFVRKGFEPVFEVPVKIARPEAPLGTHVFTMAQPAPGSATTRWLAVTIGGDPGESDTSRTKAKTRAVRDAATAPPAPAPSTRTATEALDRIDLPADAIARIAAFMTPGASLIIADQGLGPETGLETDFIVLTR